MAKKDCLGFTYNDVHSESFGILRVINGDRHKEDLLPEMTDITVSLEGADGMIYYGRNYKKRDFTINFAFNNMTEDQKRGMQQWLMADGIHDLKFDERPDVVYSAKITGKATLSFIPFESSEGTIYKGEGTIIFTCYYPFGRVKKGKGSFSQILPAGSGYKVDIINNGDLETRPVLTMNSRGFASNSGLEIRKGGKDGELLMKLKNPTPNATKDNKIFIDCKNFLIYDSSGSIYNDKIVEGDFFSIPAGGEWSLYFNLTSGTYSSLSYEELYY